jgi:hypothetical protein
MAFSPLTQLIALLSGTGKLINRGGAKGATSAADVTSTAIDADHQALDVKVCATVAPSGVALDATLTGGTCKAIARGGAKGATSAADCTSRSIDADHQALDVYDASCASIDGKFPTSAAMTSDAEAASNTSRIGTRNQAWDDTQNSGSGGWSKLRAGLAKLTAATGKRSDGVGMLHTFPFARYIQPADRPTLTTQDIIQLIVNARGDLAIQEQYQPVYENNVEGYAEVALNPRGSTTSGWCSRTRQRWRTAISAWPPLGACIVWMAGTRRSPCPGRWRWRLLTISLLPLCPCRGRGHHHPVRDVDRDYQFRGMGRPAMAAIEPEPRGWWSCR